MYCTPIETFHPDVVVLMPPEFVFVPLILCSIFKLWWQNTPFPYLLLLLLVLLLPFCLFIRGYFLFSTVCLHRKLQLDINKLFFFCIGFNCNIDKIKLCNLMSDGLFCFFVFYFILFFVQQRSFSLVTCLKPSHCMQFQL